MIKRKFVRAYVDVTSYKEERKKINLQIKFLAIYALL